MGGAERRAPYDAGASRLAAGVVAFAYEVTAADDDADGVSVAADGLALDGGATIVYAGGSVAASLGHDAVAVQSAHKVGGPRITGLEFTEEGRDALHADGFYTSGEVPNLRVTFSEAVTTAGNGVFLNFDLGGVAKTLGLGQEVDGQDYLYLYYIVRERDFDADGLSIPAGALVLGGGTTIQGGDGRHARLAVGAASFPDHRVNGRGPFTLAFGGALPADGVSYLAGETIAVTMTFGEPVTVTGAPSLGLQVGGVERRAAYAGGTGTEVLTFAYAVAREDRDADGVSVAADSFSLDGGSIVFDFDTAPAVVWQRALDAQPERLVGRPYVVGIEAASAAGPDGIYRAGDTLALQVTFSEALTASPSPADGGLTLALDVGGTARVAAHVAGASGDARTFRFEYRVLAADLDGNGVSVPANGLVLAPAAALEGAGARGADRSHRAQAFADLQVYGTGGNAVSVASAPAHPTGYATGETIAVRVVFAGPVTVTGTPALGLEVGDAVRRAPYSGGAGTAALTFAYEVQSDVVDADGVSVPAGRIALEAGAAIHFADGSGAAFLGHPGLAVQPGHKVNAVLIGIAITSLPADGDAYVGGETIEVTVTFGVDVTVTGTPTLLLESGSQRSQARYAAARSTERALRFVRTVTAADGIDDDGVLVLPNSLSTYPGSIDDDLGAAVPLNHAGASFPAHRVRAGLTGIAITSQPAEVLLLEQSSGYRPGDTIEATLTFGADVAVTGTPTLGVEIGAAVRPMAYDPAGSTARVLRFGYAVRHADGVDGDGVRLPAPANRLEIGGGSITDGAGAPVPLPHAGAPFPDHAVYAGLSEIAFCYSTVRETGGDYLPGDRIGACARFHGPVVLTGTPPTLGLEIAGETRRMEFSASRQETG